MSEEWRDVPGYEGLYQASTLGRVRSLGFNKAKQSRILNGSVYKTGYHRVELWKDGTGKSHLLHRVIAVTFINKVEGKTYVNHIDGDKSNNAVANLEWVTQRENVNHYWRKLKNKPLALTTGRDRSWRAKKVACVETGEIFPSIQAAAKFAGVHERLISAIVNGDPHRHRAGGYHWELAS